MYMVVIFKILYIIIITIECLFIYENLKLRSILKDVDIIAMIDTTWKKNSYE